MADQPLRLSRDFLRGRRRNELTVAERDALEDIFRETRRFPARTTIVRRGEAIGQSMLLLSGWLCRYMDARDGRRQLMALHVPGDFADLHAYPLRRLDHDVATLTEVTMAIVSHDRLTALLTRHPNLTRLLWFSTLLDAAMHREWIFRIGRLPALGRVAHLLCETHARLEVVGRTEGGTFDFPLTQQDLGEACGLTAVHVNRTLSELRRQGLASITQRRATIHDLPAMYRLAEFDGEYLYRDGTPLERD